MSGVVNLSKKGMKVDLTKGNPGLDEIEVGLGWDANAYDGKDFDLDASVFLLGADGKVRGSDDFIFYNNQSGPGVQHMGDNRTGEGDGDDEVIKIKLSEVPAEIERIAVTVTIHEAEKRGQTFGQVRNAYVRVVDATNGEEKIKYDLEEDFSIETSVVTAELYRHNGEWKFNTVGAGYGGGLAALCGGYGIQI